MTTGSERKPTPLGLNWPSNLTQTKPPFLADDERGYYTLLSSLLVNLTMNLWVLARDVNTAGSNPIHLFHSLQVFETCFPVFFFWVGLPRLGLGEGFSLPSFSGGSLFLQASSRVRAPISSGQTPEADGRLNWNEPELKCFMRYAHC